MQLGLPVFGGVVDARPFARGPGDSERTFVVDEGGRIMLDTRSVRSASAGQFRDAVLAATPRMQFKPARLRGCPVKQLVGQEFNFQLRH